MDSSKPRKLPYQMADYQSRCCFLYTHFVLAAANIVNTFPATGRVLLKTLNPLNPELNPICYLLALLRAHHFLHVSRIRVKLLTFRLTYLLHGAESFLRS